MKDERPMQGARLALHTQFEYQHVDVHEFSAHAPSARGSGMSFCDKKRSPYFLLALPATISWLGP